MNLAVSNLAWEYSENELIHSKLKNFGVNHVEGVLTKIKDWSNLSNESIIDYKKSLNKNDLSIPSIQSIFYNVQAKNLHDTDVIINHISKLIKYCLILDVKTMVLGSPTLRKLDIGNMDNLIYTFKVMDELLSESKIEVCLEPNTKIYGGQYFFTVEEIVTFLNKNNFKNIKTMIDTHNLILEDVDPCETLEKYFDHIHHIHISEPNLEPLNNIAFHNQFSSKIKECGYKKIVTLEMRKNDNVIESIKNFSSIYNN